jgi:hypothetical protein
VKNILNHTIGLVGDPPIPPPLSSIWELLLLTMLVDKSAETNEKKQGSINKVQQKVNKQYSVTQTKQDK